MSDTTALIGPALADALWACQASDGSRSMAPATMQRFEAGHYAYTLSGGGVWPWEPWLRVSDCWHLITRYNISWVQDLDGWTLIAGVAGTYVECMLPSLRPESIVASAICRLALQLWTHDHGC